MVWISGTLGALPEGTLLFSFTQKESSLHSLRPLCGAKRRAVCQGDQRDCSKTALLVWTRTLIPEMAGTVGLPQRGIIKWACDGCETSGTYCTLVILKRSWGPCVHSDLNTHRKTGMWAVYCNLGGGCTQGPLLLSCGVCTSDCSFMIWNASQPHWI